MGLERCPVDTAFADLHLPHQLSVRADLELHVHILYGDRMGKVHCDVMSWHGKEPKSESHPPPTIRRPLTPAAPAPLGHAVDKGASLQRDYVGRSKVSSQGRNLGVFVEGHHVDNVYTLAGKDDLHVNGCFSAGHVQRHQVDSLLSAVPY